MTFEDYIEKTEETAVYPKENEVAYLYIGVMDELSELVDTSRIFDTYSCNEDSEVSSDTITKDTMRRVIHEMGDVYWYVARLCGVWDISVDEFQRNDHYFLVPSLKFATKKLSRCKETMFNRIGTFKKYLRKDAEKEQELKRNVKFVYNTLNDAGCHMGLSQPYILQANCEKLMDRKERGVIKGDGDHR